MDALYKEDIFYYSDSNGFILYLKRIKGIIMKIKGYLILLCISISLIFLSSACMPIKKPIVKEPIIIKEPKVEEVPVKEPIFQKPEFKKIPLALDFKLLDMHGNTITLSSFNDKQPVVLFFWTTWCPYCRKELKMLNDIYPQWVKEGWELFAINVGEPAYRVDNFVKRYALNFKVLLDEDAAVASTYDILGVPTYFLIDKKGYIRFKDHYFPEKNAKNLVTDNE